MTQDFKVPAFLEADDKNELRLLMLGVQLELGMLIDFYDFSQQSDGKYVCWYSIPFDREEQESLGESAES